MLWQSSSPERPGHPPFVRVVFPSTNLGSPPVVKAGEGPDFAVKQQCIDLATSQAKQTTCYSPYAPTAKDMDTTSRTASSSSRSLYRLLNTQIFAGTTIDLSSQSVKTPKTTLFARMVVNTNASFA